MTEVGPPILMFFEKLVDNFPWQCRENDKLKLGAILHKLPLQRYQVVLQSHQGLKIDLIIKVARLCTFLDFYTELLNIFRTYR